MNTLLQYSLSLHCLLIVIYRVDSESNKKESGQNTNGSIACECKSNDHKEVIFELRWRNTILRARTRITKANLASIQ